MIELNPWLVFLSVKRSPQETSSDAVMCMADTESDKSSIFESADCWKENAGEQSTGSVFTGYKKVLLVA